MTATWQKILESHPAGPRSDDPDFWEEYLAEHPDVLHRLLADVYQATYGAEKPPTLDDLWAIMATPRFTSQDFGDAVLELLGDRSIRWLAQQVGIAHPQLSRYLSGQRPIISVHDHRGSMRRIESVAQALHVHPSYFTEWRRLWIMSLIDSAFASQPSLSVGIFRRFSGFEERNVRSDRSAS
jgi:hypothetical protein